MSKIDILISNVDECYYNNQVILENFVNKVFSESDFSDVDRIINFINESTSTWKNNIIYKLSLAFNKVKFEKIPIQRYIFIESYKLMAKDSDIYDINRNKLLFVKDIYFQIMQYKWDNERIKKFKYYLLMLNIIWMIDFKWSNIYFLIQSNQHAEYYNQLLFYLLNRFINKIDSTKYLWYTVRIIYSSYIYGDIMEYKFKNYNTLVNNIKVYKLLHKTYINNKWVEEEKIRNILYDEIYKDKHISNNYCSEESLDKLVGIINNPYSSEVDLLSINIYWNDDEKFSWITEEKIHTVISKKTEEINENIFDVIKLFWWKTNNYYFFLLHDIFSTKISTVILYQLKEFEEIYEKVNKVLSYMFEEKSLNEQFSNKLILNNLNYIEQSKIVEQRKNRYFEEFKKIRNSF